MATDWSKMVNTLANVSNAQSQAATSRGIKELAAINSRANAKLDQVVKTLQKTAQENTDRLKAEDLAKKEMHEKAMEEEEIRHQLFEMKRKVSLFINYTPESALILSTFLRDELHGIDASSLSSILDKEFLLSVEKIITEEADRANKLSSQHERVEEFISKLQSLKGKCLNLLDLERLKQRPSVESYYNQLTTEYEHLISLKFELNLNNEVDELLSPLQQIIHQYNLSHLSSKFILSCVVRIAFSDGKAEESELKLISLLSKKLTLGTDDVEKALKLGGEFLIDPPSHLSKIEKQHILECCIDITVADCEIQQNEMEILVEICSSLSLDTDIDKLKDLALKGLSSSIIGLSCNVRVDKSLLRADERVIISGKHYTLTTHAIYCHFPTPFNQILSVADIPDKVGLERKIDLHKGFNILSLVDSNNCINCQFVVPYNSHGVGKLCDLYANKWFWQNMPSATERPTSLVDQLWTLIKSNFALKKTQFTIRTANHNELTKYKLAKNEQVVCLITQPYYKYLLTDKRLLLKKGGRQFDILLQSHVGKEFDFTFTKGLLTNSLRVVSPGKTAFVAKYLPKAPGQEDLARIVAGMFSALPSAKDDSVSSQPANDDSKKPMANKDDSASSQPANDDSKKPIAKKDDSVSSQPANDDSKKPMAKLFQRKVVVWVSLILFYPLGLVLLWKSQNFSKRSKITITSVFAIIIVFALLNDNHKKSALSSHGPAESNIQKSDNKLD